MQYARTLDVIARPDVLVCGAGCAGTVAALAAARNGASVLLVERFGFAGGYITGVIGASFDGWVDLRSGLPVVGGIVSEFAQAAAGGKADVMSLAFSPSNELREMAETPDRNKIRFNIEGFKRQADRLFRESGVQVLYYTSVVDVIRRGDRVEGVVIANKGGLGVVLPKMIVDASGDADVAAWGGGAFEVGADMQPAGLSAWLVSTSTPSSTDFRSAITMLRAGSNDANSMVGRLGLAQADGALLVPSAAHWVLPRWIAKPSRLLAARSPKRGMSPGLRSCGRPLVARSMRRNL